MPLYTPSSTIFGSIMMSRTSSGRALYSRLRMREFMQTDLPEPVVPAMSIWGSFAILPTMQSPPMSLPRAKLSLDLALWKRGDSMISRR